MQCPPILETEEDRLVALARYGLSSDRALPSLDPVVRIAAHMFDMPVSAVNMIGNDHVFFAAATGINADEVNMSRDVSFCAHAIAQDDVLVVPDATLDDRFHDNPLVTGTAGLRFYAGVALHSPDGHALGALCVIDSKPRAFSPDDAQRLRELAKMAADRLELRRVELAIEHAEHPFEVFARNSPTAVVWFDAKRRIVAWNHAAAMMHGHELTDGAGRSYEHLVAEADRPVLQDLVRRAKAAGSVDGLVMPRGLRGLRRDGTEFLLGLSLFCWHEQGTLTFNAHLQDLSTRHNDDAQLRQMANTDMLTGLSNRVSFYRRTEEALSRPAPAATLVIDLDSFKDINDTLGHTVGDDLLRAVAQRLLRLTDDRHTVARIGGDEFAILMPGETDPDRALSFARKITAQLAEPIVIDGTEIRVAASCGVALAPPHAQEALELISHADLALFHAKHVGRGQTCIFVPTLRAEAATRRLYNIELHRAVHQGEFLLFYQPQMRLRDGSLSGAEALLRWHHPERGLLSPAAFLPALESGPLAALVGAWVLDEACAQAALWRRRGAPDFRIGVNLFSAQFLAGDLIDHVTAALERHGLPPNALELEITENIVLGQSSCVLSTLRELRQLGVGIAFDDFGTGYASLSMLKQYPLSRIKIDRSFVQSLHESEQDAAVVRAILDMARTFGLDSIAEGIELSSQHGRLESFGCAEGQGYLYAQPMPAPVFATTYGLDNALATAAHP